MSPLWIPALGVWLLRRRVDALREVTVPAGWGSSGPSVDPAVLTGERIVRARVVEARDVLPVDLPVAISAAATAATP